jgi:hypothetical protein
MDPALFAKRVEIIIVFLHQPFTSTSIIIIIIMVE